MCSGGGRLEPELAMSSPGALPALQVVMAAKHPDDVITEMHTWSKWADADTLQRLFTQGGGMEMLTADGVKSVRCCSVQVQRRV